MLNDYFVKMKGTTQSPPRVRLQEILWSWVGGLIGIAFIGLLDEHFCSGTELVLIIAPFGASAVLVFGATKSPLAQPRNLLGGHILSAVIGVSAYRILPDHIWLAAAVAVATAIAVMHATKTLHPPGGATALIAVIGGEKIHGLGYFYALVPVAAGAAIMLAVALLVNNIPNTRRYPEFWL
jgi:CBS-domain-containing membrane protein